MVSLGRRAAVLAAGVAFGGVAVLGAGAPAQADENGSEFCDFSTGSITVKNTNTGAVVTSVPYGTNLTVSWTVNAACPDFVVYMGGPGFDGSQPVGGVSRSPIWATPPDGSNTLTWSLAGIGVDASMPRTTYLDEKTITVTGT